MRAILLWQAKGQRKIFIFEGDFIDGLYHGSQEEKLKFMNAMGSLITRARRVNIEVNIRQTIL